MKPFRMTIMGTMIFLLMSSGIAYGAGWIIEQPRTHVRGFLPCMLRMSDSVGTYSIHGLTSGDLRRYFKSMMSSKFITTCVSMLFCFLPSLKSITD
jgi:hypothetical protein